MFTENFAVASSILDVCTAYLLSLTLLVTVASAERIFTKLKLTKNYLHSTMPHERLSGLSVLNAENKIARSIDINKIINTFAFHNAVRLQNCSNFILPFFNTVMRLRYCDYVL